VKEVQDRSANEMAKILAKKDEELKTNPKAAVEAARVEALSKTTPAYIGDVWTYRTVVVALGLTVVIAALGSIYIAKVPDATIPDVLLALGSAAVGALAGLLMPFQPSKT
jgi:hypothetical protein